MRKLVQKSNNAGLARRANAVLLFCEGHNISTIASQLQASRNSIRVWIDQYQMHGEAGLIPDQGGRPALHCLDSIGARLIELIQIEPKEFKYARSRWTSEMLAGQVGTEFGVTIHPSTVRRWLPKLGIHWNRAKPTLNIRVPDKASKISKIKRTLKRCNESNPVFYVDEVDIDLNPKVGSCWSLAGQQVGVSTPGKNEKRYLCGALHAKTGKVIWVEWKKKNTDIFLLMMAELRKRYRKARRIHLILDNYRIHKSQKTMIFLKHNPKFNLVFQPAYHPWVNKIELLWKWLHDSVTRNHKHSTMNQLMNAVRTFMKNASILTGTQMALLKE